MHYVDPTTLVVFDNGNVRRAQSDDADSRGQVLTLNEQTRDADLILNADLGNYSVALGSAQKLPNGNYVFTSGFQQPNPPNTFGQSIEVLPDGTTTYVLQISGVEYRSYRMANLYGGNGGVV